MRVRVPVATTLGLIAAASTVAAQSERSPRWVTTWTASTFAVPAANVQPIAERTVRQVARISLGGDRVRVRLSNEFGDQPLRIGSARIAHVDSGAVTVAGSDRPLTFGGRPSIVIRPGGVIVSDPLVWRVPAGTPVAVSLHLPDTAFVSTLAIAGPEASYVSTPGDHAAESRLPVESARVAWMFLAGIDVDRPRGDRAIVAFGNSLTGGAGATTPDGRWPDVLARRLRDVRGGTPVSVVVASVNGTQLLTRARTPSALTRFDRDVLGQAGVTDVIILEGGNDIALAAVDRRAPVTATEIILGLTQLATRAHDHGLRAYVGTLLPFEGSTYNAPPRSHGPEADAMRQEVNAWIRANAVFDGVIDFDACVRDPSHPTRLRPAFDSGDHLHLNDAGYRAMGECVDLRLFRPSNPR